MVWGEGCGFQGHFLTRVMNELTITILLHVVLHRDDALVGQRLNFGLAIGLPIVDIFVLAHSQWPAREDDGSD